MTATEGRGLGSVTLLLARSAWVGRWASSRDMGTRGLGLREDETASGEASGAGVGAGWAAAAVVTRKVARPPVSRAPAMRVEESWERYQAGCWLSSYMEAEMLDGAALAAGRDEVRSGALDGCFLLDRVRRRRARRSIEASLAARARDWDGPPAPAYCFDPKIFNRCGLGPDQTGWWADPQDLPRREVMS